MIMLPASNFNDHDQNENENAMDDEGLNEMLTHFFGNGNNDDKNDHMFESNGEKNFNYHQHNVDDRSLLKDSIKQATKSPVF